MTALLGLVFTGMLLAGPGPAEAPQGAEPVARDAAPSTTPAVLPRALGVGLITGCSTCGCGALPGAVGAVAIYESLRGSDAVAAYATGLFCGLGLCALPAAVAGTSALSSAVGADLWSGDALSFTRALLAAAAASAVALGAGMLALAVTYPAGLVVVESGARDAARLVYGGVPLLVVGAASLLAGGAAGGMYAVFSAAPPEE